MSRRSDLHPRDNVRLLETLTALREKGNSLVIVEHDEETMRRADHIIDLGPGAGMHGGEVVVQGTLAEIQAHASSETGRCLRSPLCHPTRESRRSLGDVEQWIEIRGAHVNNLKNVDARFPVNRLSVITGISGSGKSTLMRSVLLPAIKDQLAKKNRGTTRAVLAGERRGAFETVYEVDQSPIGKTSRSTPATYIKVFDEIRNLYAQLPVSRVRGYTNARFSFNTEGGRCETCKGQGVIKLEMSFLPSSYVPCEDCGGRRYSAQTLEVLYHDKSIGDVMDMTIEQAAEFFAANQKIARPLGLLVDTGLGYLKLGQPSPTLSGGEAQRLKLATELTRGIGRAQNERIRKMRKPKSTLYLLEEPTIGLHMADVELLLKVLHRLVDEGNTVIVIEHNLSVIAEADYVVDIGPEAGADGGEIVAIGTPEEVAKNRLSRTAPFLREVLKPAARRSANGRAITAPLLSTLAYYLHNLDPFIFRVTETFGPRWYGMAYVLAFLSGYLLLAWLAKRGYADIARRRSATSFPGRRSSASWLAGASATSCSTSPRCCAIRSRSCASGKVECRATAASSGSCSSRSTIRGKHKMSWTNLGDNLCVVAPLGLFFGRCANFVNGELYGRPATVAWAVQFPKELLERKTSRWPNERSTLARADRSGDDEHRSGDRGRANESAARGDVAHRPHSAASVADLRSARRRRVVVPILWFVRTRMRQPNGVITGLFLSLYAVFRIIVGIFPRPGLGDDRHVHARAVLLVLSRRARDCVHRRREDAAALSAQARLALERAPIHHRCFPFSSRFRVCVIASGAHAFPEFLAAGGLLFAFEQSTSPAKSSSPALLIGSIFSWSVMITKLRVVRFARSRRAQFRASFRKDRQPLRLFESNARFTGSPLFNVYRAGCQEMTFHLLGSTEVDETFRARLGERGQDHARANGCGATPRWSAPLVRRRSGSSRR